MHHLAIKAAGNSRDAEVQLDGHEIATAITGLRLDMNILDLNRVHLELVAVETTADVQAQVILPPATHDLLVRLGWTPPAEDGQ